MRSFWVFTLLLIVLITAVIALEKFKQSNSLQKSNSSLIKQDESISQKLLENVEKPNIVASDLETPWAIAFLPDNNMLVTERKGTITHIDQNLGAITVVAKLPSVKEIGEGGLLGIAVHPNFSQNNFVYFYYTYSATPNDNILNRVVRMIYVNQKLSNEEVILEKIPGASNHNGGRIKFGPDGFLYIGTGDAQEPSQAQKTNTMAGKILRITDEGKIPAGNKFNNPILSYGHRNVQGLAWDKNGNLWATEHGRSGVLSGLDEINFIENGENYGWPEISGDETRNGIQAPKKNSGSDTWAPSGAAFVGDSLFFSGLYGQALYEAVIENNQVIELKEHFKGEFGRIREVILGPDNMLYITTSNKDGRGVPGDMDDKVIRVNPKAL